MDDTRGQFDEKQVARAGAFIITIGLLLAASVLSVALLSVYIWLDRTYSKMDWDWTAMIMSIGAGVVVLAMNRINAKARIVVMVLYAISMWYLLPVYAIVFVCSVFGDCL